MNQWCFRVSISRALLTLLPPSVTITLFSNLIVSKSVSLVNSDKALFKNSDYLLFYLSLQGNKTSLIYYDDCS